MEKNLYIDASHPEETRIVLKSDNLIEEYEFENKNNLNFKNNIYLGTISRVEPSLQAAFINFGRLRHGFLAFNDIQSDYFQIPAEDKEKLKDVEQKIREDLKNTKLEDISNQQNNQENIKNKNINNEIDVKLSENSLGNEKNYREKLKKTYGMKKYKIQEVMKPGQVLLVQVLKEERGQKGAALTTFISLAGKFLVLMPNTPKGGEFPEKYLHLQTEKE